MLYHRQYSYLRLMMWSDAFCAACGLLLAYALRFGLSSWYASNMSGIPLWFPAIPPYEEGFFFKELLWTLPACMLVWPFCLGHYGLYDPERQRDWKRRRVLILQGSLLATVVLMTFIFVFKLEYTARIVIVGTAFLTAGLLELKEFFLKRYRVLKDRQDDFHLLILRKGPESDEERRTLERYSEWGAKQVRVLSLDGLDEETLTKALIEGEVDEIACFCPLEELFRFWPLVKAGGIMGLQTVCYFPTDKGFERVSVSKNEGVSSLSLNKTSPDLGALTLKLIFDKIFAFILLVLLSPLFLIIAILVKQSSPGPVFWRQTRVGRNGHLFTLYKFRSMVADAEEKKEQLMSKNEVEGWAFKMERDPRVTPIGRFLRRFSLDELPQLWNVVLGSMSLVGPRPSLPEEVEHFAPGERRRLSMKPGMTGLWQVSGRHTLPIERWISLDLEYVDNWTLILDIKILFKTIVTVLKGSGR
ncbi:sugar transferase [bacterium]|nr:sugar transferase [bacterium]